MFRVRVNGEERDISDVRQTWLNRQINGRREAGENVCVQVICKSGDIDLLLSTPGCGGGGGGSRPPRPLEEEILGLWKNLVTSKPNFTGGNITAFLKQARKYC